MIRLSPRISTQKERILLQLHTVQYVQPPLDLSIFPHIREEEDLVRVQSTVITGNVLDVLGNIPDELVRTVITSPPYWSLRDYAIPGQIGSEENVDDYIDTLVQVFTQIYRILAKDGTLWLNIGDSYTSGNRTWRAPDKKNPVRAMTYRPPTPQGLKPKELVGIPWRLAFALQAAGWYLRSDIIWRKGNPMPESVKDRPTHSHEYIFLLTKSEQYYYNNIAAREVNNTNLRSVWDINTHPFPDAHFATFPPKLVERCLLLSSKPNDIVCDPFLGSGTVGMVSIQHGRAFLGVELNPQYVEITRNRLARIDEQPLTTHNKH
jgi:site-specific DNA-methyltransferase (cytosine-N4-specific)